MHKYRCKSCGTSLGYDGLCWRCRSEQEREQTLTWTEEEIAEKLRRMVENPERLADYDTQEHRDFWSLLCYHGICSEDVALAAVQKQVYTPAELYYRAPAEVRDVLVAALLQTEDATQAAKLMCCLAMQGDDVSLQTLLELERNPRPWRKKLYVNPSVYAQCGGWSFDAAGNRTTLGYDRCYSMVKGNPSTSGYGAVIGRLRTDTCPHCGVQMMDMLVLDGRDPRLGFLGMDGIITASCCPNCVCFTEAAFSRFTLDGGSVPLPLNDWAEENYIGEELTEIANNAYVLGSKPLSLFYAAKCEDLNTIGGFANWIQDWVHTVCPDCGAPMRYLAQLQWDTLSVGSEGTLYIEICPHCQIVSMFHQQT